MWSIHYPIIHLTFCQTTKSNCNCWFLLIFCTISKFIENKKQPSNKASNDSSLVFTSFCISAICSKRFKRQSVASIGVSGSGILGTDKKKNKAIQFQIKGKNKIVLWNYIPRDLVSSASVLEGVSMWMCSGSFFLFQGWAHKYNFGWSLFL